MKAPSRLEFDDSIRLRESPLHVTQLYDIEEILVEVISAG
jgi:hypothetical protein